MIDPKSGPCAVRSALIVGGGVGGMAAAIALRRADVAVTLIDADPNWRVYGAGITVTGLSLRAFDALGLLADIKRRGFVSAGMRIKTPAGQLLREMPAADHPTPLQCSGGILRPALHDILSTRVREGGVDVRLGVTVRGLAQDEGGVDVAFSAGEGGRYDLVVGADGIYSAVRGMIFPNAPAPKFTGQGCWRVLADRPAEVDRGEMYVGGPVKVGLTPISSSQMYMFVLEHVPENPRYEPADYVPRLKALLAPFGGHPARVRDQIADGALINYRPLEWILLPDPWRLGRVILIGDAAHATTPHLASGAGLAVEDALVLAEELSARPDVGAALEAFMTRRYERARLVVMNSVRIGEIEMSGENTGRENMMLGSTMHELQAPY